MAGEGKEITIVLGILWGQTWAQSESLEQKDA